MEPNTCISLLERILRFLINYTSRNVKRYKTTKNFILQVKTLALKILTTCDEYLGDEVHSDCHDYQVHPTYAERFDTSSSSENIQTDSIDPPSYESSDWKNEPWAKFRRQLYNLFTDCKPNKSKFTTVNTAFSLLQRWYIVKFRYSSQPNHCKVSADKFRKYLQVICIGYGNSIENGTSEQFISSFNDWLSDMSNSFPLPYNLQKLQTTDNPGDVSVTSLYLWQALFDSYFDGLVSFRTKSEDRSLYPYRDDVNSWMFQLADSSGNDKIYNSVSVEDYLDDPSILSKYNIV